MLISTLAGLIDDRGMHIAPETLSKKKIPDDITAPECEKLRQWKIDHRLRRWGPHIVNVVATMLVCGYILFLMISKVTLPNVLSWVLHITFFIMIGGIPLWLVRQAWRNKKESLLLIKHCPNCALDLKTIPPESDGCIVCRECGFAWHIDNFEANYKQR